MARLLLPSCYLISFDKEGGITLKTTGSHAWHLSPDILIPRIAEGRRLSWILPSTCAACLEWSSINTLRRLVEYVLNPSLLLLPAFIHLAATKNREYHSLLIHVRI